MKKPIKTIALVACMCAATSAQAIPLLTECADLPYTNHFPDGAGSLGGFLRFEQGETLVFSVPDPSEFQALSITMSISGDPVCNSPESCDGASYTFPTNTTESLDLMVQIPPPGTSGTLVMSCLVSDGEDGETAAASAAASSAAIRQGLYSAMQGRLSGTSALTQASQDHLFFSRQAEDGTYVWANLKATSFSGALDGQGGELTMGLDWQVASDTYAGLLLSYGSYNVASNGVNFDNSAWSFGPYLNAALSDKTRLEAYLAFASPKYESSTSYRTERVLGGLTLRSDVHIGTAAFEGYAGIDGFRENLPASAPGGKRSILSQTARLGARFELNPASSARPFVRIGADANHFKDGSSSTTSISPSLGLGVEGDLPFGGYHLVLDGSEIFGGANATTLSFGINFSF